MPTERGKRKERHGDGDQEGRRRHIASYEERPTDGRATFGLAVTKKTTVRGEQKWKAGPKPAKQAVNPLRRSSSKIISMRCVSLLLWQEKKKPSHCRPLGRARRARTDWDATTCSKLRTTCSSCLLPLVFAPPQRVIATLCLPTVQCQDCQDLDGAVCTGETGLASGLGGPLGRLEGLEGFFLWVSFLQNLLTWRGGRSDRAANTSSVQPLRVSAHFFTAFGHLS